MDYILRNFVRGAALAILGTLALLTLPMTAPNAAEAPVCAGKNLMDDIAAADPAAHAEILKQADAISNGRALLWRIEGKDAAKPSWLFGTVHLSDDRVNAMTPASRSALDSAEAVAIEIAGLDDGEAAMMEAIQAMMGSIVFTDGRKLADFLTAAEIERLDGALSNAGIPAPMAEILQPWFASVLIALPVCEMQRAAAGLKALDFRIEAAAMDRGITRYGLETHEEQFEAMASLPFESQLAWLKTSIILYDRAPDLVETMVQLYLDRRVGAIWPLNEHIAVAAGDSREAVQLAMREFQLRLVELRNHRMAERFLPLLKEGGLFVAVGAAHLPGEQGLVELVRKAGYSITAAE